MSVSRQIIEFLAARTPHELHTLSPQHVAQALGLPSDRATKLMHSLEATERIKLLRVGAKITGVERIIRVENKRVGMARLMPTPELDRYMAALQRVRDHDDNEFITVAFKPNPLAEEAMLMKEEYARVVKVYNELRQKQEPEA